MTYRIITIDKQRAVIEILAAQHFDNFTIYPALLVNSKGSLVIEVDSTAPHQENDRCAGCAFFEKVKGFASKLRTLNHQDSVLLQSFEARTILVRD